jgi:hypothetical protein
VKRAAVALVGVAVLAGSACGASVTGDYEGVPFSPTATAFAVLDRHDFIASSDQIEAVRRNDAGMRIHLFFTAAPLDASEAWAQWSSSRLLDVKQQLAITDGLVLMNIPLQRAQDGEAFEIELAGEGTTGTGDFDAAVVVADPSETIGDRGFGDFVTVRATFASVDAPARGGFVAGQVEVKRARARARRARTVSSRRATSRWTSA